MSENLGRYEQIDLYLRGELSQADTDVFEQLIQADTTLAAEVEAQRLVQFAVEQAEISGLREEIGIHFSEKKKETPRTQWWIGGALGVLLLIGGVWWLTGGEQPKVVPQPSIETPQVAENQVAKPEGTRQVSPTEIPGPSRKNEVPQKEQGEEVEVARASQKDVENQSSLPIQETSPSPEFPTEVEPEPEPRIQESNLSPKAEPCGSIVLSFDITAPCEGEPDGKVVVMAKGGTPPYIFSWDSDDSYGTTNTYQYLFSGVYDVYAKDAKGCLSQGEVGLVGKECREQPVSFEPAYESWEYYSEEKEVKLQVFNGAGQLVFETEGVDPIWEGLTLDGQDAPVDLYLYMIFENGNLVNQGQVSLIR